MNLQHPTACLTHGLMRAARSLSRGFEAAAVAHGMSAGQFTALAMFSGHGSMTVSQIAAAVAVDRTTMTRNLAVMAAKGWIAEADAEDRRERAWALTEAGRKALNEVMPIWQDWQAKLVAKLGAEGAGGLLGTLKVLSSS
jgi:DNA-binding MarR family transcriptional regulator